MKIRNYDVEDSENNDFVQLHDFMPDRTFRLLLTSPSGGGKTNLLLDMIYRMTMATCHVYALLVLFAWFSLPTTLPIRTKISDTTYFNLTTISVDQSFPFKQRHVIEDLLYNSQNLKIGHLNVNSIFGKSDEVINLLDKCAFDILFISESKIDESVSTSLFTHSQYRIIRRDRKKGGGGLLVYIRSNVTARRQVKFEPEGIESICLDVKGCANNWFLVCACYRSPGKCKVKDFIPACASAAEKMYVKRKEVMFIGDFNMNMLESPDNPNGPNKDLTKFSQQFCLTNVIHEATRTTNYSRTLLDIVLTSHPERLATSGILQVGISDHDLIFVVRKQKLPRPKARTIEFRSLKHLDSNTFLSDLRNVPWDSAYIYDNIDDIWAHWFGLYKQVLDEHAPVKRIQLRNNQLPWISPDIQKQIRIRNRLYKKFRRAPTDSNWCKYKEQRNRVTGLKRRAVKNFCADAASGTSSAGLFWKKMKPLLPNNKSNTDGTANIHLLDDGKLVSNPSNVFNDFFVNPRIQDSALSLTKENFGDHPSIAAIKSKSYNFDFAFKEINKETVTNYVLKMNAKKSTGPDGFSPKIVKLSAIAVATPLTSLFNYCIRTSTLPKECKMSNVTPIHKKGDVTDKNNYRPVSVISAISKLFEKVLFDQMYASFVPIFSPNMSGFLKGHSCATALIKLTDDWRRALDEKKEAGVVAIDLSKAFDCICHNLLLAKLKAYGLQEPALQLLRSFLHDRKQRVICNNTCSSWSLLQCGVPQGSLLSPLLFNIFMNDMNESVSVSSLRLYADDTTEYMADESPLVLQHVLNQDIEKLSTWLNYNYLQANGDKTQAMILGNSTYNYDLEFDGTLIDIKEHL